MNTYTSRTGKVFPHEVDGPTGHRHLLTGRFGFFGFPGGTKNDYRVVAEYANITAGPIWLDDEGQLAPGTPPVVHDQWVENI